MKRVMIWTLAILICTAAMPALSQDGPPPQREGGGPGGGGPGGGGPGGGGPGGRGPGGFGGGGRPMNPDGGGPGGPRPEMRFEALRSYIDVVDRFSKLTSDPTTSGVAAVVAASDLLKQRGPDAAIEYFNKTLPEVKNEAVQRAIRIQLVDLYKASGQSDKALEQLDLLMKGAPLRTTSAP